MANAGGGRPLKVLIADDARPVAEMLAELVAGAARVEVVGLTDSQADTMEAIRTSHPDVVLLDLQLKSGSGTDVIRAVRADAALASVRIAVTSNHTSPQLRTGCLALGAEAYFDKVKELGELTAWLRGVAGG